MKEVKTMEESKTVTIYLDNIRYKEYRHVVFDGHDFIMGVGEPTFITEKISNNTMLADFLNFNGDDIDSIIFWCEEHGLPFSDSMFQKLYYENGENSRIIQSDILIGQLDVNEDKLKKINGFLVSQFFENVSIVKNLFIQTNINKDNVNTLNLLISKVKPYLIKESNTILLTYKSTNHYAVGAFQMASMLMEIENIKRCDMCKKWFSADHGLQRICTKCRETKGYNAFKQSQYRIRKGLTEKGK